MKILLKAIFKNFLIFSFFTRSIFALEPVVLTDDKGEYALGLHLEILEDKTGELTIDDVRKPEMESKWFKSKWEVPNFGYSASVYWVRFEVKNESKENNYLCILSKIINQGG